MKMRYFILLLFSTIITSSYAQRNKLALTFVQGKNEYNIKGDTQTIKLDKEKFKILFNSFAYTDKKSYATQIDAFFDAKGITMIHPGIKIEDIPYFAPGSGLACARDKEYECIYIDKDFGEQEYIIYDEVNKERRAKLEGRNGDTLRLSWDIKKFSLDNKKELKMRNIDSKPLYIVVLNDFNLNGIVDEGEYCIVKVLFQ